MDEAGGPAPAGSEIGKACAHGSGDLRGHLRAATMAAHDLLDRSMQAASGWQCRADYARFLALQHAARAPLEAWFAAHAPVGLSPPEQTGLIARDLAGLGEGPPPPAPPFARGSPGAGEALGAAWVLAGSALGNRAILRQVERAARAEGAGPWPVALLSDGAMLGFWQDLRGRIERPAEPRESADAAAAAGAVFAHFLALAESAQS